MDNLKSQINRILYEDVAVVDKKVIQTLDQALEGIHQYATEKIKRPLEKILSQLSKLTEDEGDSILTKILNIIKNITLPRGIKEYVDKVDKSIRSLGVSAVYGTVSFLLGQLGMKAVSGKLDSIFISMTSDETHTSVVLMLAIIVTLLAAFSIAVVGGVKTLAGAIKDMRERD